MDNVEEHDGRTLQHYEEYSSDGFDAPDEQVSHRVIIGLLHTFDSSGEWFKGGLPSDPKEQPAAVSMRVILQRWQDKRVIDMRTEHPLPDLKSLNESVPIHEWELDLSGNPKPPGSAPTFCTFSTSTRLSDPRSHPARSAPRSPWPG
jgi:hypothetical protein